MLVHSESGIMTKLATIQKQIEQLQKQAAAILKAEAKAAAETVRALIARHGLSAEDVGLAGGSGRPKIRAAGRGTASKTKSSSAPKYRDPASGKTWTGNGKPPGWIAGTKDRSAFLIGAASDNAAVTEATTGMKNATQGGKKPVAKSVKAAKTSLSKKAVKASAKKATARAASVKADATAASAASAAPAEA